MSDDHCKSCQTEHRFVPVRSYDLSKFALRDISHRNKCCGLGLRAAMMWHAIIQYM